MSNPRYVSATVGTGGVTAGAVVRISSATAVICDADSSQAATAALLPFGVAVETVAAGVLTDICVGPTVNPTAGAAIAQGDRLVCLDGGAGTVIPYDETDYTDGATVNIIGIAQEAAASGAQVRVSWGPFSDTLSIPA